VSPFHLQIRGGVVISRELGHPRRKRPHPLAAARHGYVADLCFTAPIHIAAVVKAFPICRPR